MTILKCILYIQRTLGRLTIFTGDPPQQSKKKFVREGVQLSRHRCPFRFCVLIILTNYNQILNNISIYKFSLSVCLFISNKRQNGWTDRAQIFCGTSRDPREGLWMIKISNICLHQNWIFIKFLKILKIPEIFCENPWIMFVLFYDVHKENMFTINLEDGREAPSKASFLNCISIEYQNLILFSLIPKLKSRVSRRW